MAERTYGNMSSVEIARYIKVVLAAVVCVVRGLDAGDPVDLWIVRGAFAFYFIGCVWVIVLTAWDHPGAQFLFAAGVLSLIVYFLWEQRAAIMFSLLLLVVLAAVMGWLLRPVGRVLHVWAPWILLFRLMRELR